MEKASLEHYTESIYSHPISDDEIELRLRTKKDDDITKVELVYNDKYKFTKGVKTIEIKEKISDDTHTYYIQRMKLGDKRFAYVFKIYSANGESYYFSESGLTKDYDITQGIYDFFQVPYVNCDDYIHVLPKFQNRVFYQIFVDRFCKDPENNNPRINIRWGDTVNTKTIAGGTLKGITSKLDYLKDLGINVLYLTPIFRANSNHKYDTIDYYKVDDDFGNETDLKELIDECHKRDILILLDGVFNHVSRDHEFFKDVIKNGKNSKYFDYFYVHGDQVDLKNRNYETFAYAPYLPRLNINNKEVQKYILSVASYYVKNFGIDGFRLDVADEIPHFFWVQFRKLLLDINPEFIILGENWHNAQSFLNSGTEFHSIMNYSIMKNVLNYVAWNKYSAEDFKNEVVENLMRYKTNVNFNLMNMISSHDVARFFTECQENEDKFLLGYAFIFTHIGIPCVYYGDEIALPGENDPLCRACFNWDKANENSKVFAMIKKLIHIHREHKINEKDYHIEALHDLVFISRSNESGTIKLYLNASTKDIPLSHKGNILISNHYENNILKANGFVMTEE